MKIGRRRDPSTAGPAQGSQASCAEVVTGSAANMMPETMHHAPKWSPVRRRIGCTTEEG
jgi:hypothetical protein